MSTTRSTRRGFAFIIALGLMFAPIASHAQQSNRSVSVRFILSEKFSGTGVSAVVAQTGGPNSEYLIAVRREFLNVETMSQCLYSLTQLIKQSGGRADARSVVRIAETAILRPANDDNEAKALLNRLRSAERKKVPRITGDVQSFEANIRIRDAR